MPPATQQPTNMTAVYAARLARHEPYYRKHNESRASTSASKRSASNVYKGPDTEHDHASRVSAKPSASNASTSKRPDLDPAPASCVSDKLFDASKSSNDEDYPSVLSKVLYYCW